MIDRAVANEFFSFTEFLFVILIFTNFACEHLVLADRGLLNETQESPRACEAPRQDMERLGVRWR